MRRPRALELDDADYDVDDGARLLPDAPVFGAADTLVIPAASPADLYVQDLDEVPWANDCAAVHPPPGSLETTSADCPWSPEPELDHGSWEYLWPRLLLLSVTCAYGTNFPVGAMLVSGDGALPASEVSCLRFAIGALALLPWGLQLDPKMLKPAAACGLGVSLGYVAQSLALVDTAPSTVAFLGALTVIVCPMLEAVFDKREVGLGNAPQTWLAAFLSVAGVAVLEGVGPVAPGMGDVFGVLQAVGFGFGFWRVEKMVREEGAAGGGGCYCGCCSAATPGAAAFAAAPVVRILCPPAATAATITNTNSRRLSQVRERPDQMVPITFVMCAVSALVAGGWAVADGTLGHVPADLGLVPQTLASAGGLSPEPLLPFLPAWSSPAAFAAAAADDTTRMLGAGILWTGLVTTALTQLCETISLKFIGSAEASVLVATESVWAAVFGFLLLGETVGVKDGIGGALIVAGCVASSLSRDQILGDGAPPPLRRLAALLDEQKARVEAREVTPLS